MSSKWEAFKDVISFGSQRLYSRNVEEICSAFGLSAIQSNLRRRGEWRGLRHFYQLNSRYKMILLSGMQVIGIYVLRNIMRLPLNSS